MKRKIISYMRDDEVIDELREKFDVTTFYNAEKLGNPVFDKALSEAEAAIGLGLPVTEQLLEAAPNLKIVSNVSVGYDNLDIDAMTKKGVMATNTPNILDDTTADAIFALLMATARRVAELDHLVKSGQWNKQLQPSQYGVDVHHRTLGIIGMGNIGQAIAKRAHFGFDMDILYYNRRRNIEAEEQYHAEYCELNDLLERSDYICLMVPATPETYQIIGEAEFKRMKKSAIFINGSRGQNVDEKALYEALKNGEIHAAGTDVFVEEPTPKDNPLLKLKNIVTLPHIGSSTTECELAMTRLAADNLLKCLEGKKPPTLINMETWNE